MISHGACLTVFLIDILDPVCSSQVRLGNFALSTLTRKEVICVKWKIIQIYVVEAETRNQAMEQFAVSKRLGTEDKFFQSEFIKKHEEETGWVPAFKKQVMGK